MCVSYKQTAEPFLRITSDFQFSVYSSFVYILLLKKHGCGQFNSSLLLLIVNLYISLAEILQFRCQISQFYDDCTKKGIKPLQQQAAICITPSTKAS
jgi:hypothetical protein